MATNQPPDSAESARNLVNQLLDQGYNAAVTPVMTSLLNGATTGVMGQRLRELEAEAERLALEDESLTPDNPILRATIADFETALRGMGNDVNNTAGGVQAAGVAAGATLARQLTLPGLDDATLAAIGFQWNVPSADVIASVVQYTSTDGWAQEIGAFDQGILRAVNNHILAGVIEGRSPIAAARDIAGMVETLPLYSANNLLRTLHLTSYRDMTSLSYIANADILEGQVRIATLDTRTCLCCVSLHGEIMPVGARVYDHHSGRCTSIGLVRGRPRQIRSGIDWWGGLSNPQRLEIAGAANYAALEAGAVQLRDFVQPYQDQVFGPMVREASLKGILGEGAKQYYSR